MDLELKNYKVEVEVKFKVSQLKNYTFPRATPKQSEAAVSSKDVLQKLLKMYQHERQQTLWKSSSLLGVAKTSTVPVHAKSKSKGSLYNDSL